MPIPAPQNLDVLALPETTQAVNANIKSAMDSLASVVGKEFARSQKEQNDALSAKVSELQQKDQQAAEEIAAAALAAQKGMAANADRVAGLEKVVSDFRTATQSAQTGAAKDVADLALRTAALESLTAALEGGTPDQVRQLIEDTAALPEFKSMLANLAVSVNGTKYVATDVLARLASVPTLVGFVATAAGYDAKLADGSTLAFVRTVDSLLETSQERHTLLSESGALVLIFDAISRSFGAGNLAGTYTELSLASSQGPAFDPVAGLAVYVASTGDLNGDGVAPSAAAPK